MRLKFSMWLMRKWDKKRKRKSEPTVACKATVSSLHPHVRFPLPLHLASKPSVSAIVPMVTIPQTGQYTHKNRLDKMRKIGHLLNVGIWDSGIKIDN